MFHVFYVNSFIYSDILIYVNIIKYKLKFLDTENVKMYV